MREHTANILLGSFLLGGILLGLGTFALSVGQHFKEGDQRVVMVFDSSVKGLTVGAPVALRGVSIGEVTDIRLRFAGHSGLSLLMEVEATLDGSRITRLDEPLFHTAAEEGTCVSEDMIEAGLRAQLNVQSLLTGLLYVQLDFFPDSSPLLRAPIDNDIMEIPTIASPFDQFIEEIGQLNLSKLASDVQGIVQEAREFIEDEQVQSMPGNANRALIATSRIAEATESLLTRLEPQVEQTLASTTTAASTLEQELPAITRQISDSLEQLNATLASFETVGESMRDVLAMDSPLLHNLNTTLEAISRASRSLDQLAESVNEQPQSLIRGRTEEEAP